MAAGKWPRASWISGQPWSWGEGAAASCFRPPRACRGATITTEWGAAGSTCSYKGLTYSGTSSVTIKKTDAAPEPIELAGTADVLSELVRARAAGQLGTSVIVGFAAETGDGESDVLGHGRAKLARKGCDLLVVNEVSERKAFGRPDNAAVILSPTAAPIEVPLGPKTVLAAAVWDAVVALLGR